MRTIVKDLEMMEITALYIEDAQEVAETRQEQRSVSRPLPLNSDRPISIR